MPCRLAYALRLRSLEKIGDLNPTGSTKNTERIFPTTSKEQSDELDALNVGSESTNDRD